MGLQQTRFFADGGTKVVVVCRTVAIVGGGCLIDMSVSGYLVDLPSGVGYVLVRCARDGRARYMPCAGLHPCQERYC